MHEKLEFSRDELKQAMREGYDDLIAFFLSEQFQAVWSELRELPRIARYKFIKEILLNPERLQREYGVHIPDGIMIQRSAFGDGRPTLFCMKKYLPEKFHSVWENVNLTFDEKYADEEVSRAPEKAWQAPVMPDVQALLVAAGVPLSEVPDSLRVKMK